MYNNFTTFSIILTRYLIMVVVIYICFFNFSLIYVAIIQNNINLLNFQIEWNNSCNKVNNEI